MTFFSATRTLSWKVDAKEGDSSQGADWPAHSHTAKRYHTGLIKFKEKALVQRGPAVCESAC